MPRIRVRKGAEGKKTCAVTHKKTKMRYVRPRNCELRHLGRKLVIETEGPRGSSTVVLKGRELNSLGKLLVRAGEVDLG